MAIFQIADTTNFTLKTAESVIKIVSIMKRFEG
jgi:hypothetical protein